MAVQFGGANGNYLEVTVGDKDPATLMFWYYRPSDPSGVYSTAVQTNAAPFVYYSDIPTYPSTSGFAIGGAEDDAGVALPVATWCHITLVLLSNGVQILVNGTPYNTVTAGSNAFQMVRFGNNSEWGEPAEYAYSAVKMWNAALSSSEIAAEMYEADPVKLTDLVGVWKTQYGTSYTLDSSGNNAHMTQTGSVTDVADPPAVNYGVSATLTQEGFRWRNDDGSESTATWADTQDTDITLAPETPVRIRILVDASGAPNSSQFRLEYKLTSDSNWSVIG